MRTNTFVQKYIEPLISDQDTVVDMTAGNGNDTLFLSKLARKVYAFDISEEALTNTAKKLTKNNVELILDDHSNIDKYIKEKVRLFIFNLGYLPGSDDKTVTLSENTLIAYKKAYEMLEDNGYVVISFYKGHAGGLSEFQLLNTYFKLNDAPVIARYRSFDHQLEPEVFIIKKNH